MTGWHEQLDRFEAGLVEQRRALVEGRPEDVEVFVPHVAGPLPAELSERAGALSVQADALAADLAAAAAAVARQLKLVTVMKDAPQPTSSYVDRRG